MRTSQRGLSTGIMNSRGALLAWIALVAAWAPPPVAGVSCKVIEPPCARNCDCGDSACVESYCGGGGPAAPPERPERGESEFNQSVDAFNTGYDLKNQGRCSEAVPYFRRAIALRPDFMRAHWNLGDCLMDGQDYAGAEQALRTAISLDGKNVGPLLMLGGLLHKMSRFAEAEQAFRAALRLDKSSNEGRQWLSFILTNRGAAMQDQAAAAGLYREAIGLNPDNQTAKDNLSIILNNQAAVAQDDATAARLLREAIELNPGNQMAKDNLNLIENRLRIARVQQEETEAKAREARVVPAIRDSVRQGTGFRQAPRPSLAGLFADKAPSGEAPVALILKSYPTLEDWCQSLGGPDAAPMRSDNGMARCARGKAAGSRPEAAPKVKAQSGPKDGAVRASEVNRTGVAALGRNDWAEAVKSFKEALKLDPGNSEYLQNLRHAEQGVARSARADSGRQPAPVAMRGNTAFFGEETTDSKGAGIIGRPAGPALSPPPAAWDQLTCGSSIIRAGIDRFEMDHDAVQFRYSTELAQSAFNGMKIRADCDRSGTGLMFQASNPRPDRGPFVKAVKRAQFLADGIAEADQRRPELAAASNAAVAEVSKWKAELRRVETNPSSDNSQQSTINGLLEKAIAVRQAAERNMAEAQQNAAAAEAELKALRAGVFAKVGEGKRK